MINTIERHNIPAEVRKTVANYLSIRDGSQMVTMSQAIGHLRARYPSLAASDRRLTDVVAGQAIILGLNIELDGDSTTAVDRWSAHRHDRS